MLAEAEVDRLIGVVLGGAYQLVGRIGEGGMGAVYEAHHLRLQKRVAVKVMNRWMARHPDALTRFYREASIASRLGHPHLVNVIDFGTSEGGEPYLVMEHLEGEDLDRRLRRAGSVPLRNAVQIVRQVASALSVVHAKGVVHRDLKPANIFLVQVPGEPDFVKVLDFGVSKIKAARTKLTDASTVIGTPEYMSPEQASGAGDEIDHRADQWSLACIVWEMLAGRSPFYGDNSDAVFYQLINQPPPPLSKYAPDLPSAVEPVLLRALSKSAGDRYPSTREFSRALETSALGSWTELTPMPFSPAQIAALRAGGSLSAIRPGLSTTMAALTDGDSVVSGERTSASRRGWRLRAALAGLAVVGVIAATGLLFADARSRTAGASPAPPSRGAASVARVNPTVAPIPPGNSLAGEGAVSPRASAPRPGKSKGGSVAALADPFDRGTAAMGTGSSRKTNPFFSSSRSAKRPAAPLEGRPVPHDVARSAGKRLIFEEL